jgi:hypothetical protein
MRGRLPSWDAWKWLSQVWNVRLTIFGFAFVLKSGIWTFLIGGASPQKAKAVDLLALFLTCSLLKLLRLNENEMLEHMNDINKIETYLQWTIACSSKTLLIVLKSKLYVEFLYVWKQTKICKHFTFFGCLNKTDQ